MADGDQQPSRREQNAQTMGEQPQQSLLARARGRIGAGGQRVLTLFAGAVIALLVNNYGLGVIHSIFGGPERLGSQLDSISHTAANDGYEVSWHKYVTGLHGAGKSLLMKLSDVRGALTENAESGPDEFRIYDLRESEKQEPQLVERFRFRPSPTVEVRAPTQWRFNVQRVVGITNSGKRYVIGAFTENRADYSTQRPVMIYWDDQIEKYTIRALIPRPAKLEEVKNSGARTATYLAEYEEAEHLVDHRSGLSVDPYAATAYVVCGGASTDIRTIGAYWVSEGGPPPRPRVLQLVASSVSVIPSTFRESTGVGAEGPPHLWTLGTSKPTFPADREITARANHDLIGCDEQ